LAAGDPARLNAYGWILVSKGKVAEGLPLIARAVEPAPGNQDVRRYRPEALEKARQEGST